MNEAPLCKCGCGERTQKFPRHRAWLAYVRGHRPCDRRDRSPRLCACGCGVFTSVSRTGPAKWILGHSTRKHGSGGTFDPKEAIKNGRLLRKYGITRDDYEDMLLLQGNTCAICRRPDHGRNNKNNSKDDALWCVDHDHKTGAVRGLLCHRCNAALGLADDSVETLRKMADYLERHKR